MALPSALAANPPQTEDWQIIATIADLKKLQVAGQPIIVWVQGYHQINDGGSGLFYWDAASTAADNGGTVIKSQVTSQGAWLRCI